MKSTGSVVITYLIFEFSFQPVLFTCIRYYVCIVHILCMKMHYYFLLNYLNIKHGASQLHLGENTTVRPQGGASERSWGASNSLAPALANQLVAE